MIFFTSVILFILDIKMWLAQCKPIHFLQAKGKNELNILIFYVNKSFIIRPERSILFGTEQKITRTPLTQIHHSNSIRQ